MMPMVSSMAPLHFLGQDNQIERQNHFFDYGMPLALALASHDSNGTVNRQITLMPELVLPPATKVI